VESRKRAIYGAPPEVEVAPPPVKPPEAVIEKPPVAEAVGEEMPLWKR
jgi:hypothetical protein